MYQYRITVDFKKDSYDEVDVANAVESILKTVEETIKGSDIKATFERICSHDSTVNIDIEEMKIEGMKIEECVYYNCHHLTFELKE